MSTTKPPEDKKAQLSSLPVSPSALAVPANPPPLPKPNSSTLKPSSYTPTQLNTKNLGLRFGADTVSAASASALVAPLICVIDRSIVSKAATNQPFQTLFLRNLRPLYTSPHTFLLSRPFFLIFTLYFGTYLTANSLDTLTSAVQSKPADTVTAGPAKFLATSTVNLSLCVYKDSCFAKMFGGNGNPSPTKPSVAAAAIPRLSYALFATRDSLTIFASFNLPPLLAPYLSHPFLKNLNLNILSTDSRRLQTAQFLTPALMQIFSTPIHLLGLDLFNRQGQLGMKERWKRVSRDWAVSSVARMGRIVPAFGVGGVVNAGVRRRGMKWVEGGGMDRRG